MYHYVRDLLNSRHPKIKGLDLSLFIEQIEYLKKNYIIITMEELIDALDNNSKLPQKAALLTFDDGYIDHYLNVFPILEKNKLQGSFFPPVKAITGYEVLYVNKIHYILASVENMKALIADIFEQLNIYRNKYDLQENDYYFQKLAVPGRYDKKEVIFIKRLLQVELEEEFRNIIINHLFRKYVSKDESAFSRELYMSPEQITNMIQSGMHFGSHGYAHYRLGLLSRKTQENEIDKSIEFIREIGGDANSWTMCYPFGHYNEDTISILKQRGCKLGLTVRVNIADMDVDQRFELPRLNTNDIPKQRNAELNNWYHKAE